MKVLFLLRAFPPMQSSGSIRSAAFAHHLPTIGVQPSIVCASPEATGHPPQACGAAEPWKDDDRWGAVVRIPWHPSKQLPVWMRRVGLRMPVANTAIRNWTRQQLTARIVAAGRELIREQQPDALYASYAPAETLMAGHQLANEFGLPWVADLRDAWSYVPSPAYRHWLDFLLERRLEYRTLRTASAVIAATETSAELLIQKIGLPRQRVHVIPNGYNESELAVATADLPEHQFHLVYAGELASDALQKSSWLSPIKRRLGFDYDPLDCDYSARSPRYVLEACEQLLTKRPELRPRLRIWFVGLHPDRQPESIRRFPFPECIKRLPRVSPEQASAMVLRADLLLLLQNIYRLGQRDFCPAIPAKLYLYLRTGNPILACLQPSEAADLIASHAGNRVVDPRDPAQIAQAIEENIDHWTPTKRVGRSAAGVDCFERARQTLQLAEIFKSLRVSSAIRGGGKKRGPTEGIGS